MRALCEILFYYVTNARYVMRNYVYEEFYLINFIMNWDSNIMLWDEWTSTVIILAPCEKRLLMLWSNFEYIYIWKVFLLYLHWVYRVYPCVSVCVYLVHNSHLISFCRCVHWSVYIDPGLQWQIVNYHREWFYNVDFI